MKKKYRIVTDYYNGYSIEVWRWWFPFWVMVHGSNTLRSPEELERWKKDGFPNLQDWIYFGKREPSGKVIKHL